MDFRVSANELSRRKRIPFFLLSTFTVYGLLTVFTKYQQDGNIDISLIITISSIFLLIFVITIFINQKYIKLLTTLHLKTKDNGLYFTSDVQSKILWNEITKITLKGSPTKVRKLRITLRNNDLIELSIYDNLEILYAEINKNTTLE